MADAQVYELHDIISVEVYIVRSETAIVTLRES